MINKQKIKEIFLNYTNNYENSGRKKLKVEHILRVANISYDLAISLKLNEEDCNLAYLIGIFHDIGRFEQVKLYDTFSDALSGIDHAEYSNKVLFNDGLIRKFISTDKYDEIIKTAVYNHNKKDILKDVKGKELLFSKIIRDADKLDILYLIGFEEMESIFWFKDFDILKIDQNLLNTFEKEEKINYKDIKNNADHLVAIYSYVYDLNFNISLQKLVDNKYLDIFTNRLKNYFTSGLVIKDAEKMLNKVKEYIKKLNNT